LVRRVKIIDLTMPDIGLTAVTFCTPRRDAAIDSATTA
jgi:hypothetical protein